MNVDELMRKWQDIEELRDTIEHLNNMLTAGHSCNGLNQLLDYFWDELKDGIRMRCEALAKQELVTAKAELEELLK